MHSLVRGRVGSVRVPSAAGLALPALAEETDEEGASDAAHDRSPFERKHKAAAADDDDNRPGLARAKGVISPEVARQQSTLAASETGTLESLRAHRASQSPPRAKGADAKTDLIVSMMMSKGNRLESRRRSWAQHVEEDKVHASQCPSFL